MEKKEIILQKTTGGVVAEKIKDLALGISINDGNINITGQMSVLSILEKEIVNPIPYEQYNIRLSEVESQLAGTMLSDEQKAKLAAKKAIFETLNNEVFAAIEKAVKAINNG